MKIFITIMLFISCVCVGQQNTYNKEAEFQRFVEQGGKVETISHSVYRLTNRIGESRTFYFDHIDKTNAWNDPVDTTIINIWEIDTTKYADMFKFWQQVQVANAWWAPLPIDDLNNNNRPELYGYTDIIHPNLIGPVKIFERNISGIFQDVYTYDSLTNYVKGLGDINGTGSKEIFISEINDNGDSLFRYYPVYSSDTIEVFPTTFDFFFYFENRQINNMTFGDWDNNGITDCAFTVALELDPPMCILAEYRDSINNFEEVFSLSLPLGSDVSGFAIDDFDQDRKNDLVISTGAGNILIIENNDVNKYSVVNQFPFPIHNTYMQTATNDIDENGKPEFWIGGQDFENGITVLQCYEADGDNNYRVVAYIELRYLVSLFNYYIQSVDLDGDDKEELVISIGNVILILKFAGYPNNHQYKLWYAKLGEATQPGAGFYPAAIADLDGDGKKDLIIPMEKYTTWITYAFSYILRRDGTSSVNDLIDDGMSFESIRSYPNPFNSMSTISFNIIDLSEVQLMIFDMLGKEVNILLDKELSPGNQNISWDAKDSYGNSLPSGIYLIVLKTKNSIKTFKSILIK